MRINSFLIFFFFIFHTGTAIAERDPYWVNYFAIKGINISIISFYLDIGRFPSSKESLNSLFIFDKENSSWNGPYLEDKYSITDYWKNDFIYIAPDSLLYFFKKNNDILPNKLIYAIYSIGENCIDENGKGDDQLFLCYPPEGKNSIPICNIYNGGH